MDGRTRKVMNRNGQQKKKKRITKMNKNRTLWWDIIFYAEKGFDGIKKSCVISVKC